MATPPIRTPLEQSVYDALRNAEFATRYWPIVARRCQSIDLAVTIGVTFFSCGAVASLIVLKENPGIYQTLSVLTAAASIAQASLGLSSRAEAMYQASAKWVEFRVAYLQLWNALSSMTPQQAQEKFNEIQRSETSLTAECLRFPNTGETLKDKIMSEVIHSYP